MTLYFNFNKEIIPDDSRCYNMVCSTEYTLGTEIISQSNRLKTRYCFEDKKQIEEEEKIKCYPNYISQLVDNKCVCGYPYKCEYCEECEKNFITKKYH